MSLGDKFKIFSKDKGHRQLALVLALIVGSLVLLWQLVRPGILLIFIIVAGVNYFAINSFRQAKLDILYKHKSKLQLAMILLVMFLALVALWYLVHFWVLVIALLIIVNLTIFISYQKDMAVPFVESWLAKEYLRMKAKIPRLRSGQATIGKSILSIADKQYQKILQHFLILFLNSQKSFELLLWNDEAFGIKFDASRQTLSIKTKDVKNQPTAAFFDFYRLRKKKLIAISLGASTGIILSIVFLVFIIPSFHKLNAFTYGWVQTSWTGGASTTTVAVHPGDKTSWLQYFWASANMFISTSLTPNSVATSTTDTSDADWQTASSTNYYILNGKIVMRMPPGASCTSATQCTSDECTDGLCTVPPVPCDGSGDPLTCGNRCTYEGVTYPTVQVNATTTTQCWMAKNLNVGTMIASSTTMTDDNVTEKWCYNNHETNPATTTTNCSNGQNCGGCDTDGGLYTWAETMALPNACNNSNTGACAPSSYVTGSGASAKRQGICPAGWHIPSDYEWWGMENYFDTTVAYDNPNYYADQIGSSGTNGLRGTDIGTKLICTTSGSTWTNCGSSNLKIPVAGIMFTNGTFSWRGSSGSGYTYTASQAGASDPNKVWTRQTIYGNVKLGRYYVNLKYYGMSVRCIKD